MARPRLKDGRVVTRKLAKELAREAEETDWDLSKAIRHGRGRPPLGESGTSPRLQLRIDQELADRLSARAKREGRTVSEVARNILRDSLA
ncbi:MAG: ribbon-helix-helix protein, CopG family [Solirubrobacterales bacterium]